MKDNIYITICTNQVPVSAKVNMRLPQDSALPSLATELLVAKGQVQA